VTLQAAFVDDVTLRDGAEVLAGATVEKIWSVKNVSQSTPFPAGTHLHFANGDLEPLSLPAVSAAPAELFQVRVTVRVPPRAGHFRSNFRLAGPDGALFDPHLWVDVVAKLPEVKALPASESKPTPAPSPSPAFAPESAPAVETKRAPAPAPTPAAVPAGARADKQDGKEKRPAQPYRVSPPKTDPEVAERYTTQLHTLTELGFNEPEILLYLLCQFGGDVQKVIDWLCKNGGGVKR